MTNTNIRQYADELSDVLMKIEDAKVEASAIIEAAKEAGINTKALRRVAKEMCMQSDKLLAKYEAEEQLDMFRAQVGIFKRKGLDGTDKAATAHRALGETKVRKAAKQLDGMIGSDLSGSYEKDRVAVNRFIARELPE